VHAP